MLIHLPSAPLDAYVACLWQVRDRAPYRVEHIAPTGTVELLINFGEPQLTQDRRNPAIVDAKGGAWVCGLQTQYIANRPPAFTDMMGVSFKPGGAWPFFGIPQGELADRQLDLDLLWRPAAARELRERLGQMRDPRSRFALLERTLLTRYRAPEGMGLVEWALRELSAPERRLRIREVSRAAGVSQKHLIDRFRRFVGLSPKSLERVLVFNRLAQGINYQGRVDWARLAAENGYYDQSHLIRDFQSFTGVSPQKYVERRRAAFGDEPPAGHGVYFIPVG